MKSKKIHNLNKESISYHRQRLKEKTEKLNKALSNKAIVVKIRDFFLRNKKYIFIVILAAFALFLITVFVINAYYSNKLSQYIKNASDTENLEARPVALVLGAGLAGQREPGDILKDRLDVAFQLLKQAKISKIIVSGDNREVDYNEPQAMTDYLVKRGVEKTSIVQDYAGRRTYDSCYRTKEIFGQTKIYVVTQDFHILRAVYTCRSLGVDAVGITSDLHSYQDLWANIIRDYVGMVGAVWDTKIVKPKPVLGDKIDIN